jgi:hypothetical protein
MSSIIQMLKDKGIVLPDAAPLKARQYDFTNRAPIIAIPRNPHGAEYDFFVYDNVTSPDGVVLIQGNGTQYAIALREEGFQIESQKVNVDVPFGAIGHYPIDYYLSSRQFISDLESRCK